MTEKMSPEERKLYDARADHEAWGHALEILQPWVESARVIGHPELTRVMETALAEAERELGRTLDVLEPLVEGASQD